MTLFDSDIPDPPTNHGQYWDRPDLKHSVYQPLSPRAPLRPLVQTHGHIGTPVSDSELISIFPPGSYLTKRDISKKFSDQPVWVCVLLQDSIRRMTNISRDGRIWLKEEHGGPVWAEVEAVLKAEDLNRQMEEDKKKAETQEKEEMKKKKRLAKKKGDFQKRKLIELAKKQEEEEKKEKAMKGVDTHNDWDRLWASRDVGN